ncbi:hypothetical protein K402DRAFT_155101 [Aulographum hederae CBS 113979]|uniref:HMG box domain-containing protein n=1 Tax=Aulographum hederae CBS 113979 TaxID=1176131 RepID=A0A6G1GS26_9PEZI|nr:hypothetical protein K402DRAFT_155101 [Aulographum hederae CBS 113979]
MSLNIAQPSVEFYWNSVLRQAQQGSNIADLPLDAANELGQDGIEQIRSRFSAALNSAVNVSQDAGCIRFSTIIAAYSSTDNMVAPKSKSKVPRPPNAFIIYRKDWHPIVKAAHPGMHNNGISKIIGDQWNNETEDVKMHYKSMAEDAKQKHLVENPGYQYQPRKPSEKKRRMTKTKAAKIAQATEVLAPPEFSTGPATTPAIESTGPHVSDDVLSADDLALIDLDNLNFETLEPGPPGFFNDLLLNDPSNAEWNAFFDLENQDQFARTDDIAFDLENHDQFSRIDDFAFGLENPGQPVHTGDIANQSYSFAELDDFFTPME